MINGIAGKPGGGKSYEAVKNHVIPAIKSGRRVVTNLPLMVEHFVSVYGEHVRELIVLVTYDFHDYGNQKPFSRIEDWLEHQDWKNDKGQGVLFVIDEAHLSLPSRMQKGSGLDITKVLEFLSMHRHYGFDVLLITQNFKKVHADIRDMIQLVYRCIKKSMFGQDDQYIIKVHEGCTTTVVNTDEREYESYVFKFYKSHTKSENAIVEATTVDVIPWWKSGLMRGAMGMGFLFLLMLFWLLSLIFGSQEVSKPAPAKEPEQAISKPLNNQPLPFDELEEPINKELEKRNSKSPLRNPDLKVPKQFDEYEEMVAKSKAFHPFYKVDLAVSGYAEDLHYKIIYFSARQNGQHIFTLSTKDLALAGYTVRVLTECAVKITYFDYVDFLTCNSPTQSIAGTEQVASISH
jgi:zona occludens toxin